MDIVEFIKELFSVAGGVTLAVFLLIKFAGKWFSDILLEKYKRMKEIEFESYKTRFDNSKYITQKRYDKEYDTYDKLINTFYKAIDVINELIPETGVLVDYPETLAERRDFIDKKYESLQTTVDECRNILRSNSCFINEFEGFEKLLTLINLQVTDYKVVISDGTTYSLTQEMFNRTKNINIEYNEVKNSIRTYLQSLEVVFYF